VKGLLDFDRFAVWGLGVSGVAAANRLAELGKQVLASDSRQEGEWLDALGLHPDVRVELGANALGGAQVVIPSPGLKPSLPVFKALPDGIPIVSEIDLAYQLSGCDFVAVTGTDGKTTTTALTAHILSCAGFKTMAAGNIGIPLSEAITEFGEGDVIVAEISEFQLWSSHSFRAKAFAYTNIAEDHLDYFADMAEIEAAEHRLIQNAGPEDILISNMEDSVLNRWAQNYSGPTRNYGFTVRGVANLWSDGSWVYEDDERVLELSKTLLQGRHNALNMMAAAQIARGLGLDWDQIAPPIAEFKPLSHRLELCAERQGVKFYDDSKATNAHAAIAGIKSLARPVVVISGGVEKGLPLESFAETLKEFAVGVFVIGDIRPRMTAALRAAGVASVQESQSLEEAVVSAYELALSHGADVVLSPACSSFDMFKSYAHRGEVFQETARLLETPGR